MKKTKKPAAALEIEMYSLLGTLNAMRPMLAELTHDLKKGVKTGKMGKRKQDDYHSTVSRLVTFINDVLPPDKISDEDIDAGNYTLKISAPMGAKLT